VEAVDARSHGFTIEKNLRRMRDEKSSARALVPITHNYYDYSSEIEFRAITLRGMIEQIRRLAERYALEVVGTTLADFRKTGF
jgi:hypothetical protein